MTNKSTVEHILDHVTDIAGIAAIAAIVLHGGIDPSTTTLGAIVSIALGKKYMDLKRAGA